MDFSSDRRKVLTAILGCSLYCAVPRLLYGQAYPRIWCTLEAGFDLSRLRHKSSSGNRALDRAMIVELRKINGVFSIRPGYGYFDDGDSENALALSRTLISNTRGTVLFGLGLVQSELEHEFGGAALAGIAAHEGAHILQFFSHFGDLLREGYSARDMELHADYLAGYYFGRINRTQRSIEVFGRSLFEKGDYEYNDPDHHGTPDERIEAMQQGYRQRRNRLETAVERGIEHVRS